MHRSFLLGLIIIALAGCGLPAFDSYVLSDEYTFSTGALTRMTMYCGENGHTPMPVARRYVNGVGFLLTVAHFDTGALDGGVADAENTLTKAPESVLTQYCLELNAEIYRLAAQVEREYQVAAQIATNGIPRATVGGAVPQAPAPTYNPIPIPMPSGNVDFGLEQPEEPIHIYRDGRITTCIPSSSGVINC